MKVLQIHKYFSRERGGGSVTAFFETKKLLEKKGHQVIIFSMKDDKNEKSVYGKYFVDHFDLNRLNFFKKLVKIPKTIYSQEAQKKLQILIDKEQPEVAHIHNIHHYLTPSIFDTLEKNKIPIVYKLSDYKVICPNYKLFVKGKICEKCRGGHYYYCFLNRCIKNSWAFSLIGMLGAYFYQLKKTYQKIDLFLAPSEFMKKKCVEFGIPEEKIKILRNVVNTEGYQPADYIGLKEGNYFLYYGRISEEKGIDKLIQVVGILKKNNQLGGNKLFIIGQGPEKKKLKKMTENLKLEEEVIFGGFKIGLELKKIIYQSKFIVLPSLWYDNSPNIISETGLLGKPLIVSDRGGSREMILDKESGLIYNAGDADDLAEKIYFMLKLDSQQRKEMGVKQGELIRKINNEDNYYKNLLNYYQKIIDN